MKKITEIAIRYANGLVLPPAGSFQNDALAASFSIEMMRLGFMPNKQLFEAMKTLSESDLAELYDDVLPVLKSLVGADVKYEPMYPNFPQQVMEAPLVELYINAILHYFTFGEWMPEYEKVPREFAFEDVKFKTLKLIDEEQFEKIFIKLLSSNESLSTTDKETIKWFVNRSDRLPEVDIPFKENLCYVAALAIEKGHDITPFVKTATDVLRIATHLSDGDISLAGDVKFKSLPRQTRRILVRALERVIRLEDINRHRGKWVRLFHNLHVGEYSRKLRAIANKFRNNERIETFNSKIERAIETHNLDDAAELLMKRPGEFARRLDHLLRIPSRKKTVLIESFLHVAPQIPTRVLLQLLGHIKTRAMPLDKRIVLPKGGTQKSYIVRGDVKPLSLNVITKLHRGISNTLVQRFSELEPLGNVWIDPQLVDCPVPTQQRSASEGLYNVARGTRLPIGDKGTLRMFVYWVGRDIDLSASLHNEDFSLIERIAYYNLRIANIQCAHSGDITSAKSGASEFIDITIDPAVKYGVRYVVMNVMIYSGPVTFAEHKTCYAGWMTRSKPRSNEVYQPKTVEQRIDIKSKSANCIPVVFDLVERKAIWTDLNYPGYTEWGGNNVDSNRPTIEQSLEAIVSIRNKVSLYDLFEMHANARGTLVDNPEEADVKFSVNDRTGVTPYDIVTINSEFVI